MKGFAAKPLAGGFERWRMQYPVEEVAEDPGDERRAAM
jgi:hypothetical protein